MAQFRTDVESFVMREAVEACINKNVLERPAEPGTVHHGFVDPSGGSADDMSLCISHYDFSTNRRHRLPAMVQTSILSRSVTREFASTLKRYSLSTVVGDRHDLQVLVQHRPIRRAGRQSHWERPHLGILPIS